MELKKSECEEIVENLKKEYIANYNFITTNCKDFVRQCIIRIRDECIKKNRNTDIKDNIVNCECNKCILFWNN